MSDLAERIKLILRDVVNRPDARLTNPDWSRGYISGVDAARIAVLNIVTMYERVQKTAESQNAGVT